MRGCVTERVLEKSRGEAVSAGERTEDGQQQREPEFSAHRMRC